MNRKYFDITRKQISLSDLVFFLSDHCKVKLSQVAISKINKSRKFLTEEIKKGESLIYGVNTGFGKLSQVKIPRDKIEDLQNGALTNANVSFCTREHFGRAQADESDYYIRLAYSGISVEDINEGLIKLKDFFESQ